MKYGNTHTAVNTVDYSQRILACAKVESYEEIETWSLPLHRVNKDPNAIVRARGWDPLSFRRVNKRVDCAVKKKRESSPLFNNAMKATIYHIPSSGANFMSSAKSANYEPWTVSARRAFKGNPMSRRGYPPVPRIRTSNIQVFDIFQRSWIPIGEAKDRRKISGTRRHGSPSGAMPQMEELGLSQSWVGGMNEEFGEKVTLVEGRCSGFILGKERVGIEHTEVAAKTDGSQMSNGRGRCLDSELGISDIDPERKEMSKYLRRSNAEANPFSGNDTKQSVTRTFARTYQVEKCAAPTVLRDSSS
ncbi:hypothetical protein DL96DRAFT_1559470 [Flagelloscypha sp. PMI_526]|nr:hypothetical protein DL96DRAFT_1559470 [Flagelloscypha sp. PMI_526]